MTPLSAGLGRRARIAITDPPRALRAVRGRLARGPGIERDRFAYFEREEGPPIELWTGYRDLVKSRWRLAWWHTRLLLEVRRRRPLPSDLESLAEALLRSRTLPASPDEFAAAVQQLADAHPEIVVTVGRDERTGLRALESVPTVEEFAAWEDYYRRSASALLQSLPPAGLGPTPRALEIGCGSGYMALAAAAGGVPEVVGCDLQIEDPASSLGRQELRRRLVPEGAEVRFEQADASDLPYEDGVFDLVFSFSTLEHVRDPRGVLAELRRVLRPGGLTYHGVDPWFSPQGGHSLCILDAPWAHVRLSREELGRYLEQYRPHEARDALRSYDEGFQTPRLTLAELRAAFADNGFEMLEWTVSSSSTARAHRSLLTPEMLAECRRVHPRVTEEDLLTDSVLVVARAGAAPAASGSS